MPLTSLYLLLHILSAVIWVGGMFFAYVCLRPTAAALLEPPARLGLWVGVFTRFFPFVWLAVVLLPITGYIMLLSIWGSMGATPIYIHLMNGLGTIMMLIYMHVYFAPFKRLKAAVANQQWPAGAAALAQIRMSISTNLTLGLIVVIIASAGRFIN